MEFLTGTTPRPKRQRQGGSVRPLAPVWSGNSFGRADQVFDRDRDFRSRFRVRAICTARSWRNFEPCALLPRFVPSFLTLRTARWATRCRESPS